MVVVTNCLQTSYKSRRGELNPGPADYESDEPGRRRAACSGRSFVRRGLSRQPRGGNNYPLQLPGPLIRQRGWSVNSSTPNILWFGSPVVAVGDGGLREGHAASNHVVSGVRVLSRIAPAPTDVWGRHAEQTSAIADAPGRRGTLLRAGTSPRTRGTCAGGHVRPAAPCPSAVVVRRVHHYILW